MPVSDLTRPSTAGNAPRGGCAPGRRSGVSHRSLGRCVRAARGTGAPRGVFFEHPRTLRGGTPWSA